MVVGLALVSALSSAAIHFLVPALPALSKDLQVSASAAQYAVSVYLFGLAAGQLLAGPLVDGIGRRPVLIAGLCTYVLGATLAAGAQSIWMLCACRALQSLGAGAGLVTARVIVNDVSAPAEAGRGQAGLMAVVLISPALAPVAGGYLAAASGWRAIMAVQAGAALLGLVFAWRAVSETMARNGPRSTPGLAPYGRLVRNARYLRTVMAISLCSSALYIFLAGAPFILVDQWSYSARDAGLFFLLTAVTAIGGTALVGVLEQRVDTFRLGLAVCLVGALLAVLCSRLDGSWWGYLILPVSIITFGVGIAGPSGTARILHSEPGLAGTAASVSGAFQMCIGGLAASVVGMLAEPSFGVLATAMIVTIGGAFLLAPQSKPVTG